MKVGVWKRRPKSLDSRCTFCWHEVQPLVAGPDYFVVAQALWPLVGTPCSFNAPRSAYGLQTLTFYPCVLPQ